MRKIIVEIPDTIEPCYSCKYRGDYYVCVIFGNLELEEVDDDDVISQHPECKAAEVKDEK